MGFDQPGRFDCDGGWVGLHCCRAGQPAARVQCRNRRRVVERRIAGGWAGDADDLSSRRQTVRCDRGGRTRTAAIQTWRSRRSVRIALTTYPRSILPSTSVESRLPLPLSSFHSRRREIRLATVKPFRALRPLPEQAAAVAAVPYDVVNTEEARALAGDNPLSFLRVSRPEIEMPEDVNIYADEVYDKAAANFDRLKARAPLIIEDEPSFYL